MSNPHATAFTNLLYYRVSVSFANLCVCGQYFTESLSLTAEQLIPRTPLHVLVQSYQAMYFVRHRTNSITSSVPSSSAPSNYRRSPTPVAPSRRMMQSRRLFRAEPGQPLRMRLVQLSCLSAALRRALESRQCQSYVLAYLGAAICRYRHR